MCGSGTRQVRRFPLVREGSGVGLVVGTPCVWQSSLLPYSEYLLGSTVDLFIFVFPRRLRTLSQVSHVKLEFALFCNDVVASAFTGTRFPGVHGFRHLEVWKSPWSLRGSRGYAPHGYMGLMAGHAACCTQYTRCCPFGPCTGATHGAPGHNRWGVVETPLPVKTQGENHELFFNELA